MAAVQSAGTQRITITKLTKKEDKPWDIDGNKGVTPAHVVMSARAKLVELIDGQPDTYDKPIGIVVEDLAAASTFAVGQTLDVVLYAEAKGQAGEKTKWRLASFTPVAKKAAT